MSVAENRLMMFSFSGLGEAVKPLFATRTQTSKGLATMCGLIAKDECCSSSLASQFQMGRKEKVLEEAP